jgi:hypothetical protein
LDVDEFEEGDEGEEDEVIEHDNVDEIGQDKDSNSEILDDQALTDEII